MNYYFDDNFVPKIIKNIVNKHLQSVTDSDDFLQLHISLTRAEAEVRLIFNIPNCDVHFYYDHKKRRAYMPQDKLERLLCQIYSQFEDKVSGIA